MNITSYSLIDSSSYKGIVFYFTTSQTFDNLKYEYNIQISELIRISI